MSKFCTNCGAKLEDDSVFCEECGTDAFEFVENYIKERCISLKNNQD